MGRKRENCYEKKKKKVPRNSSFFFLMAWNSSVTGHKSSICSQVEHFRIQLQKRNYIAYFLQFYHLGLASLAVVPFIKELYASFMPDGFNCVFGVHPMTDLSESIFNNICDMRKIDIINSHSTGSQGINHL